MRIAWYDNFKLWRIIHYVPEFRTRGLNIMIDNNFFLSIVIDCFIFFHINILFHYLQFMFCLFLLLMCIHFFIVKEGRFSVHFLFKLKHFLNQFLCFVFLFFFVVVLVLFGVVSFLVFRIRSHGASSSSLRDWNTGVILDELSCIFGWSQNAMGLHCIHLRWCLYLTVVNIIFDDFILAFQKVVAV